MNKVAPRRLRRAEAVLAKRTGRILLVLERCTDRHNADAVLRTADGFGVQKVWMVEQDPGDPHARIAIANAYQRMDRTEDAEAVLRDALERDPGDLRLFGALARVLRQRGDHAEEVALYRQILDDHPDHHSTLVALGEAQLALEDVDGALATFLAVEERYPEDVQSSVRLGYLLFEVRRYLEARGRFERAVAFRPADAEVAFFLGLAAFVSVGCVVALTPAAAAVSGAPSFCTSAVGSTVKRESRSVSSKSS